MSERLYQIFLHSFIRLSRYPIVNPPVICCLSFPSCARKPTWYIFHYRKYFHQISSRDGCFTYALYDFFNLPNVGIIVILYLNPVSHFSNQCGKKALNNQLFALRVLESGAHCRVCNRKSSGEASKRRKNPLTCLT